MIQKFLAFLFFISIFSACNNDKNENVTQLISGASSKTWHPVKETNAGGDNEKLSTDEKAESWIFYSNGQVSMNLTNQAIQGNWSYNPATKIIAITPAGSTMAQTFTISNIDENSMELTAGDGSEMKLETD